MGGGGEGGGGFQVCRRLLACWLAVGGYVVGLNLRPAPAAHMCAPSVSPIIGGAIFFLFYWRGNGFRCTLNSCQRKMALFLTSLAAVNTCACTHAVFFLPSSLPHTCMEGIRSLSREDEKKEPSSRCQTT